MSINKFADIPQLIPYGQYRVDISWDYIECWLADQAEASKKFGSSLVLDPDFQRGHVWTRKQQIAWVEFSLSGGQSARTLLFNHPNWMGSYEGDLILVDGKQRLTATLAFLHNKIPAFGTLYKDYKDALRMSGPRFEVYINALKTRKDVLTWYLQLNGGGTPHSKQELDRVRELLEEANA